MGPMVDKAQKAQLIKLFYINFPVGHRSKIIFSNPFKGHRSECHSKLCAGQQMLHCNFLSTSWYRKNVILILFPYLWHKWARTKFIDQRAVPWTVIGKESHQAHRHNHSIRRIITVRKSGDQERKNTNQSSTNHSLYSRLSDRRITVDALSSLHPW